MMTEFIKKIIVGLIAIFVFNFFLSAFGTFIMNIIFAMIGIIIYDLINNGTNNNGKAYI